MVEGWQVVFRGTKLEADVAAASLEATGIQAQVITDTGDYFPGAAADSFILVPEPELEAARQLLQKDLK